MTRRGERKTPCQKTSTGKGRQGVASWPPRVAALLLMMGVLACSPQGWNVFKGTCAMAQDSMNVEEIARQRLMAGETRFGRDAGPLSGSRRIGFEEVLSAQGNGPMAVGQEPEPSRAGDEESGLDEFLGGALRNVQECALHILAQAAPRPSPLETPGEVRVQVAQQDRGETSPGMVRRPVALNGGHVPVHDIIAQARHKMMLQMAENLAREQEAAGLRPQVAGRLSAMFESGSEGIAAIGYDRRGGTSYGKYQISSRQGTMNQFLVFLDQQAPELAERLRGAGRADTGSRRGGMPDQWRAIAREDPERFESLQDQFIFNTFYVPALETIAHRTNVNIEERSPVLMEVLWSTSVQHGINGAANIFSQAMRAAGEPQEGDFDKNLIEAIYNMRRGGFDSASRSVRLAVKARLTREELMALSMLQSGMSQVI